MAGEKPKLTLEGYLDFFCNPDRRRRLTVDELNQIVFMHGFFRLHRAYKNDILDALGSLDLMSPTRSTIRNPSSVAPAGSIGIPLSLEEAKQDVQALGWQECPMGSVVTVNTGATDMTLMVTDAVPISVSPAFSPSSPLVMGCGVGDGANTFKRRKKAAAVDALLALAAPQGR